MNGKQLLDVQHITKHFGGVCAADDICMRVEAGEVHGLIGPNGAGKTTLLNLISGIYAVDKGGILFEGRDMTTMPAHHRARLGLSRTFQTPRFLQRSTIRENLLVSLDLANHATYFKSFLGTKKLRLEAELAVYLELIGFSFDLEDDISALTYGQQKLLEIVRSLLSRPKLMLVDEPAAGLNSKEIEKVMALMNFAVRERDIGVLLIEHSMDLIMTVCHNITVINFGKVICEGTPTQVACNQDVIEAYLGRKKNA